MPLYAATVLLEADGEPDEGALAVAWVIRTRVDHHPAFDITAAADVLHAVLLAPHQFSCWLSDYEGMRRARLTGLDPARWERAWRWAAAAWWRFEDDPSRGANHYLNPDLTRAGRPQHDLPAWYAPERVTVRIGHHEFLVA